MEENITELASVINNPKTQIFFDSLIDSIAKILNYDIININKF